MAFKILKWGTLLLLLLAAIGIPTGYFAGRQYLRQYLADEVRMGDAALRVVNADLTWGFNLRADSLYYDSPGLRVETGGIEASANLFGSLFTLAPSADVELDTVLIRLGKAPEKEKPDTGAPAFPDFNIPAKVRVHLKRLAVHGDSGLLAAVEGVRVFNPNMHSLRLEVDSLISPEAQGLAPGLNLFADWKPSDSLLLEARLRRGSDSVTLSSSLDKKDMLRGEHSLTTYFASSHPYAKAFMDSADALPRASAFSARVKARWDETLTLAADMQTRVSHFDTGAPYQLSPQRVALKLDLKGSVGSLDFTSRGEKGERVELAGSLGLGAYDSLSQLGSAMAQAFAALEGRVKGIPLRAGSETVTADLELTGSHLAADSLSLALITGEKSRVAAQLRRVPKDSVGEWRGRFEGDIAADERWVKPFIDTSITYSDLRVRGELRGSAVEFSTRARKVRAYQVSADSLRADHRFADSRYELLSGSIFHGENEFKLAGHVDMRKGMSLEFTLRHPEHGFLRYVMPNSSAMKVEAERLAISEIPYDHLRNLPVGNPRITGTFAWNIPEQTGEVDMRAGADYRQRRIRAQVKGDWDKDSLRVAEATVRQGDSELKASLLAALGGRQFYDLAGLGLGDFKRVEISTDGFDLRKAAELASEEESGLTQGSLQGNLSYHFEEGFTGEMRVVELQHKGLPEGMRMKELKVFGLGDTLTVSVRTDSEKETLLRDTLTLSVTGVLSEVQKITARLKAGKDLTLRFDGTSRQLKDIRGDVNVRGGVTLPDNAGTISGLDVRAVLDIPFKDALAAMRVEVESMRGTYAVPGLDTQYFEVSATVREGLVSVPVLRIRNAAGESLEGNARYELSGNKSLSVAIKGQSFAGAWNGSNKFRLNGLDAQVHIDSLAMRVKAEVAGARVEMVKLPTRVSGKLRGISLDYFSPMTNGTSNGRRRDASANQEPAVMNLSATLDSSLIRYRLKSIDALQGLFRKRGSGRSVRAAAPEGPSRPMQVRVNVKTEGTDNHIDTQILRMNLVGDMNIQGIWPYALVRGRINAVTGEIGLEKQAYAINRLEVRWANSPLEEGDVSMESQKRLGRTCERKSDMDSCLVYTRLNGSLENLQFSYETDCGGSFGDGADVTALLLSVRRGCYDGSFADAESGPSLGSRALTLLEAPVSQELTQVLSRYSRDWISSTEISGLGSLTQAEGDSAQALSVEIASKEVLRTRFRARAGYHPAKNVQNPWEQMVGLEWRPPVDRFISDSTWSRRFRNNLRVLGSVERDPSLETNPNEDVVQRKVSLDYNYAFWKFWFLK